MSYFLRMAFRIKLCFVSFGFSITTPSPKPSMGKERRSAIDLSSWSAEILGPTWESGLWGCISCRGPGFARLSCESVKVFSFYSAGLLFFMIRDNLSMLGSNGPRKP